MEEFLNTLKGDYNDEHGLPYDAPVDDDTLRGYACDILETNIGLLRDSPNCIDFDYFQELIRAIQHLGNVER